MSFWAYATLTALGSGAVFAFLTACLSFLPRWGIDLAFKAMLLLWLPLTVSAAYGLFSYWDWELAKTHSQNVGLVIVVFGLWFIAWGPGLLVGVAIIQLYKWRTNPYV